MCPKSKVYISLRCIPSYLYSKYVSLHFFHLSLWVTNSSGPCFLSLSPFLLLPACQCFPGCFPISGHDWQVGYIHAISASARSYSLLEPSSAGQINLPCQREGALRGPISRWLGRGWEGWQVTAMGPSQAWLVSISGQPWGQLGAEPQWALINASHSEAWTATIHTHLHTKGCWCTHTDTPTHTGQQTLTYTRSETGEAEMNSQDHSG